MPRQIPVSDPGVIRDPDVIRTLADLAMVMEGTTGDTAKVPILVLAVAFNRLSSLLADIIDEVRQDDS